MGEQETKGATQMKLNTEITPAIDWILKDQSGFLNFEHDEMLAKIRAIQRDVFEVVANVVKNYHDELNDPRQMQSTKEVWKRISDLMQMELNNV